MPTLLPALAPWVVPTALGALALLLSAVLVVLTRRRRLAAIPLLEEVAEDALGAERPRLDRSAEQPGPRPSLEGWDGARLPSAEVRPAPGAHRCEPDPTPAEPTPAPAPVAASVDPEAALVVEGPPTAYVALSRELAAAGDVTGAVLAQWVADLQVLRPALGPHGPDLAAAVDAVRADDPVAALRTCREAALGLVRAAGPVRALLAPLDHLLEAPGAAAVGDAAGCPTLPPALLALLPTEQRERLGAGRDEGTAAARSGLTA